MTQRRKFLLEIAGWAGVFAATLAAYAPTYRAGFVWNDHDYVTRPDLRSLEGLFRIWFRLGSTEQYYPALHGAFWVEHRLWGDSALGYHLANVLLHACAACLFGWVLRRLMAIGAPAVSDGRAATAAWLSAMLFALHPVCVESVAWISEQKNTLSAVFCLGAALAYLRWSEPARGALRRAEPDKPVGYDARHLGSYLFATFLFVLALLTKSVTAILPAALLVTLWWRKGRLSVRADLAPLLPWFLLGAGSGLFSAWVERRYVGAQGSAFDLNGIQRVLLAAHVFWFYLGKAFWPANLVFFYPRWTIDAAPGWPYLLPISAVALAAGLYRFRGRSRGPLAALLFFAGTLFPTIGFFNVYGFLFSYVADHWMYLALLGPAAAVGLWSRAPYCAEASGLRKMRGLVPLVALAVFGALTWRQSGNYRDEETLYRSVLDRNPKAWLAHNNLGIILAGRREFPEAIAQYRDSLAVNPDNAEAHNNLGSSLARIGRGADAIDEFERALRIAPGFAQAHNNLGTALEQAGRTREAVAEFQTALSLSPGYAEPCVNIGNVLMTAGRTDEARDEYRRAIGLSPDRPEAHCGLGNALQRSGDLPGAISEYRIALRLDPDEVEAHYGLGGALLKGGGAADAVAEFRAALRGAPGLAAIHYALGLALLRSGHPDDAAGEFRETLKIEPAYRQAQAQLERANEAAFR